MWGPMAFRAGGWVVGMRRGGDARRGTPVLVSVMLVLETIRWRMEGEGRVGAWRE